MIFFKNNPYADLEKTLGYRFRRRQHLLTALSHPSFRFENTDVADDNQRLEFLGDAALGLVATDYLFEKYPELREGGLTRLRSRFTSGEALARVGRQLELGGYLRLGKGEHKSGGRQRDSNVLDAMEAILGAAYLDGGLKAVRKIFTRVFLPMFDINPDDYWSDNPKGHLQALTQQRWKTGPRYEVLKRVGPSHAARVSVAVRVGEYARTEASGTTRREAERRAAAKLLKQLKPGRRTGGQQGGV